jgi:hypothetical protein
MSTAGERKITPSRKGAHDNYGFLAQGSPATLDTIQKRPANELLILMPAFLRTRSKNSAALSSILILIDDERTIALPYRKLKQNVVAERCRAAQDDRDRRLKDSKRPCWGKTTWNPAVAVSPAPAAASSSALPLKITTTTARRQQQQE